MHRSFRPTLDRLWTGFFLTLLVLMSCGAARAEPARIALVIGNSAYAASPALTALKDAGLVARTLSQAGFTVTAAGDVDRGRLESALDGFLAEAANAGPEATVVVYFAGVGLQYSGSVYAMPVGATLARDSDIQTKAVSVTAFLQRLEALPAKARVVLLDLAHDQAVAPVALSLAGGLPLILPAAGTIVGLNAAPGTIAIADVAPYGVYARALSEMIATTILPVSTQLERVRMRVGMLSNGANVPWNAGTIAAEISLGGPGVSPQPAAAPSPVPKAVATPAETAYVAALADDTLDGYSAFLAVYPDDPLAARVRTMEAVRREAIIWNECLHADLDRAYWTYMRRYRRGPHLDDAKRRLTMLHAALEPPPRFDIYFFTSAASPQPWEESLVAGPAIVFDDPAWPPTPATDAGLAMPAPAFYDELSPPPLATAGAVPIADPLGDREARDITQPDVPSIGSIVSETRFDPNRSWTASTLVEGKALFVTRPTKTANATSAVLQTGAEGVIVSRTMLTRDSSGTTIVQTGPDGGILTKAVTRGDGAGGHSTVLTNGGGQMTAVITVDKRGVTRSKSGLVASRDQVLVLGAAPGDRPSVAFLMEPVAQAVAAPSAHAFEPGPPPPLAMPASMQPTPLMPPPAPIAAKASPTPIPAVEPAIALPKNAPLPPRRKR